ncbi:MAG TPA: FxLYD domain-containing protein [Bacteroidota bacterium]|nr:FxLYD domain-containing protein [Bacteroidota bacterium]
MTIRLLPVSLVLAALLSSCAGGASDLSVVSKSLRRDVNASTAGGIGDVPSSGAIFWVEGKVKNSGTTDVRNVAIAFRVTDGRTNRVLTAAVASVPAGKTVDFRTPVEGSRVELRLVEEDPTITAGD